MGLELGGGGWGSTSRAYSGITYQPMGLHICDRPLHLSPAPTAGPTCLQNDDYQAVPSYQTSCLE